MVALFVSAWIETVEETSAVTGKRSVALFVSAWIETKKSVIFLKFHRVALFVSAWIETDPDLMPEYSICRTLRECVD